MARALEGLTCYTKGMERAIVHKTCLPSFRSLRSSLCATLYLIFLDDPKLFRRRKLKVYTPFLCTIDAIQDRCQSTRGLAALFVAPLVEFEVPHLKGEP